MTEAPGAVVHCRSQRGVRQLCGGEGITMYHSIYEIP